MELSYFGSKFLALMIATEVEEDLRYKLQCFGILLYNPFKIFFDNKSVMKNVSVPNSMLDKCHNAIFYRRVQESHPAINI